MSFVRRAFLIWMVALAIPTQGFAAATMAHCGPGHQRQQQAVTLHHGESAQAAHSGAHHDSLQAPDAKPVAESDRSGDGSRLFADSELAKSKCSACAACCIALALLPDMPTFGVIDGMSSVRPGTFASYAGFVADGPERPPRASLA